MIGRRGFLGALAGLPIAAVVPPKVSVPEVTAPPTAIVYDEITCVGPGGVTITINCDTAAFRRDIGRMRAEIERAIRARSMRLPERR